MLTRQEINLLRATAEDLVRLQKGWIPTIDTPTLRRESIVLRRLLLYGDYGRAWRLAGFEKEPRVRAPDLLKRVEATSISRIRFAHAGGATVSRTAENVQINLTISGTVVFDDPADMTLAPDEPTETIFGISNFCESVCLIVSGHTITRREVIQYVCNALGGAHIDDPRRPSRTDAKLYRAQEMTLVELKIGEQVGPLFDNIYHELLSIGYWLGQSDDCSAFVEMCVQRGLIDRSAA